MNRFVQLVGPEDFKTPGTSGALQPSVGKGLIRETMAHGGLTEVALLGKGMIKGGRK